MSYHGKFPSSYSPMLSPGKRDRRSELTPYAYIKETAANVFCNIMRISKSVISAASEAISKCRNGSSREKISKKRLFDSIGESTPITNDSLFSSKQLHRSICNTEACHIKKVKAEDENSRQSIAFSSIKPYKYNEVIKTQENPKRNSTLSPIRANKPKHFETPSFKLSNEGISPIVPLIAKNEIRKHSKNDFLDTLEQADTTANNKFPIHKSTTTNAEPKNAIKSQYISKQEVKDLLEDATSRLLKEFKDSHNQIKHELLVSKQELLKQSSILNKKVPKLEVVQQITPTFKKQNESEIIEEAKEKAKPIDESKQTEKLTDFNKIVAQAQENKFSTETLNKKEPETNKPIPTLFGNPPANTSFAAPLNPSLFSAITKENNVSGNIFDLNVLKAKGETKPLVEDATKKAITDAKGTEEKIGSTMHVDPIKDAPSLFSPPITTPVAEAAKETLLPTQNNSSTIHANTPNPFAQFGSQQTAKEPTTQTSIPMDFGFSKDTNQSPFAPKSTSIFSNILKTPQENENKLPASNPSSLFGGMNPSKDTPSLFGKPQASLFPSTATKTPLFPNLGNPFPSTFGNMQSTTSLFSANSKA